jgi:prolyl oligopeptidase
LHGHAIEDRYRWLENEDDPAVVAWCEEQNNRTRHILDGLPQRAPIHRRLEKLLSIGWIGCPSVRRDRFFIMRRDGHQNQPILYWREGRNGQDRLLLDPNTWSEGGTTAMDWFYPSDDGKLIAYGRSDSGDEKSTLRILEVDTGHETSDVIPMTRACSLAWLPDASGFYYTRYPLPGTVPEGEENYYRRVWFHRLGDPPESDRLVYGEGRDKEDWPNVELSPDGRWLLITVDKGWVASDVYVLDRTSADNRLMTIVEGEEALYGGEILGDTLWLMTNSEAPRYRLLTVDLARPEREHWREIIPESQERVLDGFHIIGMQAGREPRLFAQFMEKAVSRLHVYDLAGKHLQAIELPTLGSLAGMSGEWDGDELYFGFNSFTVPPTVFRCPLDGLTPELFLKVDAELPATEFDVSQVEYKSKDGTPITMFLIHRRGLTANGDRPTVLYGYGGFNVSMTPGFQRNLYLWLEHGGLYAIANLRGGGEYGEQWHRDGMLGKKQNVFDDYIAAAEWLISNGWTRPERLAISGGSNGGLLVGAALTQRPDLFKAVVCSVPLLDMLRYHLFRIARLWIPEYGSADDPEQFKWLYAYSPYHRVVKGTKYPAVLLMTGEADSRVDPLHARKMAALLQDATGSEQPILLRVETKAGHGAGKPLSKVIEESSDSWSFLFWQLGVAYGGAD